MAYKTGRYVKQWTLIQSFAHKELAQKSASRLRKMGNVTRVQKIRGPFGNNWIWGVYKGVY